MRIPRRKVYRAFPELDPFSDEECALLMERARSQSGFERWLRGAWMLGGGGLLLLTIIISAATFEAQMKIWKTMAPGDPFMWTMGTVLVFLAGLPGIGGLIARDSVYRHLMLRALRMRLEQIRCVRCRYSLFGQVVTDQRVRCPECGHSMTLRQLGVESADELLPPRDQREEAGL